MKKLKEVFGGDTRQFGMIFALVALIMLFQFLTDGLTLQPQNVINIFQGNSYILVLAIGMVLVIIAGHIDLSVGSIAAFAGIAVAMAMRDWGLPWWAGILFGLLLGAVIGAWQGFWVAYVGIPAFIVTLAGMLIFRGANQAVGNSLTVPVGEDFQEIGAGYLPEVGPDTGFNNLTLLLGVLLCVAIVFGTLRTRRNQLKIGAVLEDPVTTWLRLGLICASILAVTLLMASGRPGTSLPISAIILGILVLFYGFVATRTIIGRHVYAVGGNRHAAELSGVRSKNVNFLVMMNMSILSALAGMMFVARVERLRPLRRGRVGAGRHRRRVHRRCRRHRRCRHRRRLGRRRPRHGGAQQRPAAAGRGCRHDPDHQGPRPAHRRGLRRLQQESGTALDHRPSDAELRGQGQAAAPVLHRGSHRGGQGVRTDARHDPAGGLTPGAQAPPVPHPITRRTLRRK